MRILWRFLRLFFGPQPQKPPLTAAQIRKYFELKRLEDLYSDEDFRVLDERLPRPFVHYPYYSGSFLAFSRNECDRPLLCSCAEPALKNLLRLTTMPMPDMTYEEARQFHEPSMNVALKSLPKSVRNLFSLEFGEKLCHRCNRVSPNRRYCIEMYGPRFKQFHWWYVEQAFLAKGIYYMDGTRFCSPFLDDVCPEEIKELIMEYRAAMAAAVANIEREYPCRNSTPVKRSRTQRLLDREVNRLARRVEIVVENEVRQDFGFPPVGEAWQGENALARLVSEVFPRHKVIRHYRPDWLHGMELDIYVPALNLGIEYQGQQHYKPVGHWGGEEGLAKLRERDFRKQALCRRKHVTLVAIDYRMKLTREDLLAQLSAAGVDLLLEVDWER